MNAAAFEIWTQEITLQQELSADGNPMEDGLNDSLCRAPLDRKSSLRYSLGRRFRDGEWCKGKQETTGTNFPDSYS